MKRLLFFSMVYPRAHAPVIGTFCHATCRALSEFHEVAVASPQPWLERLRRGNPIDAEICRGVSTTVYPPFFYPPGLASASLDRWMWAGVRKPLFRLAETFRPEAVLSYWAHPDGAVAGRLARELGIPSGIIVGGSDVLLLPKSARRRKVVTQALNAADAVFAVSQQLAEATVSLGVRRQKVHVVYQGVDNAFCPGDRTAARAACGIDAADDLLLWVGRMSPVKGLDLLLDAFAKLSQSRSPVRLALVGDGPLRTQLDRQARQLGICDRITMVGAVSPSQLPNWYRAADLTVLSSRSEGIPNVLRESLACGTPFVSTDVGGIRELADLPGTALVPANDVDALFAGMNRMLERPVRVPADAVQRGWGAYATKLVELLAASHSAPSAKRSLNPAPCY